MKTQTFFIKTDTGHMGVNGELLTLENDLGLKVFVAKMRKGQWVVTEYSTGLYFCEGTTKEKAIENFVERSKTPLEKREERITFTNGMLEKAIKEYGRTNQ